MNRLNNYKNIVIDKIDSEFAAEFYKYLLTKVSVNTTRIYFRSYRAIFNWAIIKGYTSLKTNPFSKIEDCPLASIRKRPISLTKEEIKALLNYEPKNEKEQFALDFFWFQLNICAPNACDILTLRHSAFVNNTIKLVRNKTQKRGYEFFLPINEAAKNFIDKYGTRSKNPDSYVFPFIKQEKEGKARGIAIHDFLHSKINKPLREICKNLGIRAITSSVSRHTVATFLMEKQPIGVISRLLGHCSTNTTQSYLDTLSPGKIVEVADLLQGEFGVINSVDK